MLKLLILVICIITQRINISNYKIESIFFYLFSENNLINVPAEHLWFMYTLLKIYLLYPLIYYMFQNNKNSLKYILLFCLIFSFGVEGLNDLSLILNKFFKFPIINFNSLISSYSPILYILNYLSYFILGYYLHNTFSNKDISRKKVFLLIFSYFIGLGLIFLSRYIQTGYLFDGQYQRIQNDYSKIGNLIMCYSLFILISKIKIKNYKFFNYIGSRTLNIYYVHMTILAYAFTYLLPYFIKYCGTKLNVIRTIVTIILSIIITEILKKIPIVKKIFS